MARTVADIMTRDPLTIEANQSVAESAKLMRQGDTGAIVVLEDGRVSGIVTDRDIAVRVVADAKDVTSTSVGEACSGEDLATVGPDTSLDQAAKLMRQKNVRRIPVVERDQAVGILSIGDLAMEKDAQSALGDISSARGNL